MTLPRILLVLTALVCATVAFDTAQLLRMRRALRATTTTATTTTTTATTMTSRTTTPRAVDCSAVDVSVPDAEAERYKLFWTAFVDDQHTRIAADELNFETLAVVAAVGSDGGDLAEFMYNLRALEQRVSTNTSVALDELADKWRATFVSMATAAEARRSDYASTAGNALGVRRAGLAEAQYAFGALRFVNHTAPFNSMSYNSAADTFARAISIDVPGQPRCTSVRVPYPAGGDGVSMAGYWCVPADSAANNVSASGGGGGGGGERLTVIGIAGFDTQSEYNYHEMGATVLAHGFNLLLVDGPGQGLTARNEHLHFRFDYEVPVAAMVDWLLDPANAATRGRVAASRVVLWGRSMGGYLCARAFAYERRLAAVVLDGGLYDFYQSSLCKIPNDAPLHLRDLYFSSPSTFNVYLSVAARSALSVRFITQYANLGLGTPPGQLAEFFDALQPYTMADSMQRFDASRPILVHAPAYDTTVGAESQEFWSHLPAARHELTTLLQLPVEAGTSLHCGVGSSTNEAEAIVNWVHKVDQALQ